jgi:hypothetical protein
MSADQRPRNFRVWGKPGRRIEALPTLGVLKLGGDGVKGRAEAGAYGAHDRYGGSGYQSRDKATLDRGRGSFIAEKLKEHLDHLFSLACLQR